MNDTTALFSGGPHNNEVISLYHQPFVYVFPIVEPLSPLSFGSDDRYCHYKLAEYVRTQNITDEGYTIYEFSGIFPK